MFEWYCTYKIINFLCNTNSPKAIHYHVNFNLERCVMYYNFYYKIIHKLMWQFIIDEIIYIKKSSSNLELAYNCDTWHEPIIFKYWTDLLSKKSVNFKGWTGFVMILINLLCFNKKIMGVNLHETKIKIFFSYYSIKSHYSIKWW
jgi:hypothetical protein